MQNEMNELYQMYSCVKSDMKQMEESRKQRSKEFEKEWEICNQPRKIKRTSLMQKPPH